MFICECEKLIRGKLREDTFKDYIEISQNPSTRTIGHKNRRLIFNFVDGNWPKKYSSKKELKILAANFAKSNNLHPEKVEKFSTRETGLSLMENFQMLRFSYMHITALLSFEFRSVLN
ncbi:hypothetical protein [Methanosarcina barkeri]|uniref:hypothetical protein n=1 Tax=Methanosarcina barkeri TaxID=2208 RepID=UPI0006D1B3B3|nr:hypothetical protein [Methanosarcina barkeri]